MTGKTFRRTVLAGLAASPALIRAARAEDAPDPWPALRPQIFGDRLVQDGRGLVAIDAPYRAADAAIVPVTLRILPVHGDARRVRGLTLVIDANPSPLAARFAIGPHAVTDSIATNVRVDSYTFLHLVAELDDGSLHGVQRFVKAAGGCSAPALKNEAGGVPLGTMRLRTFPQPAADGLAQAQLMIRHPNFSGMQMDQFTRLYIPAHFVQSVRIAQGDALLFSADSGISIAENPQYRFDYRPDGKPFHATVTDSEGRTFTGTWPAAAS